MTGRRDVEADLREGLARGAKSFLILIGRKQTTVDGAVNGLVRDAFRSPDRLRDAADLLGEEDAEARALLVRAVRYAEDPRRPGPPRRDPWPGASDL